MVSVITGCGVPVDYLDGYTCTGSLELDDTLALSTKAWTTVHLLHLWLPGKRRGTNLVLPEVFGTVPYPRRIHEATHLIPMLITGCWDADGDPYDDPLEGLEANLTYLENALDTPSDVATGTKVAVLTMPSGATRTGPVQYDGLELGEPDPQTNGIFYLATLGLTLHEGRLI